MSGQWRAEADTKIESWLPFINSTLLLLLTIAVVVLIATFYEHQTFDQASVIKNQHIDDVWIMDNSSHTITADMRGIRFAQVCCRKGVHLKCFNANIWGNKLMIPNALFGYSCAVHFPR